MQRSISLKRVSLNRVSRSKIWKPKVMNTQDNTSSTQSWKPAELPPPAQAGTAQDSKSTSNAN